MSEHNYQLVAIDVDGTLLNSEHQISSGAAEALERLSDRGALAVLISGRSILLLQDLMTALHVSPYYVGSGGAMVATLSGAVIASNPVNRQDAEEIIRQARLRKLGVCYHESAYQHCEIGDPQMRTRLEKISGSRITFVGDVLSCTQNAPEKLTIFGNLPDLEDFMSTLLNEALNISMTFSGQNYLEICHQGVNKGFGLRQLIQHLGIEPTSVVAIGDQQNDLSMFQLAGLAIAMGNATAEVMSAADVIAPSNDEGGLAWAIHEVILAAL